MEVENHHAILLVISALIIGICGCPQKPTHTASYYNAQNDVKITLELYHSHPYLAEYDRVLVFGSKEEIFDSRELSSDTGGYAAENLFRCGNRSYLLDGYATNEFIAVLGAKFEDGECMSPKKKYLGIFEEAGSKLWRFCPAEQCPEESLRSKQADVF